MSIAYSWVQWNRHKRFYDFVAASTAALFIVVFFALSSWTWRGAHAVSDEVLVIRATGACAIVFLHLILCIGPFARLDPRFLPFLYNRRHLGVMTFLIALLHAFVATGYYHGFGTLNPLVSLLSTNTDFSSLGGFPFQLLGLGALVVMLLMAATSHDFWLKNLSAGMWKRLHMLVYVAYALLVGHVSLGALQNDRGWFGPAAMFFGVLTVSGLHIAAGTREAMRDRGSSPESSGGWISVGTASEIPADRARTVCTPDGERIAVFRHGNSVSAVTNVCAHQGGPLGEGKIIDGCITCPWHGWQYRPGDGCSPPPFKEKIATYQVRIVKGLVYVNPQPLPPGTAVEPAVCRERVSHG